MTTRNVRPFVHLRVLSSFSLGLGLSSPTEIVRHARRVGFDSIALTDVSGTYGFVELHRAAREVGVKPIYGVLVFLDWRNPPDRADPPHWLTLLALDRTGLRHVSAAASLSAIRRERGDGVYLSDLDGLTDGVAAIAGVQPRADQPSPHHLLAPFAEFFRDRLFIECRAFLTDEQMEAQERVLAAAREIGIAPVLVQDVRFVGPARPQPVDLMASADERAFEHRVFGDGRAGGTEADHGMRAAPEMSAWYDRWPEAYSNAAVIAAMVPADLLDALEEAPETTTTLAPAPAARTTLRARVDAAFERAAGGRDAAGREALRAVLDRELDALARTGLEPVFLKFEEITRRARDAGLVLGPASGLAFQSKCAFLLGLTSFDPYLLDGGFHPDFDDLSPDGRVLDLQVAPDDRPRLLTVLNRAFDDASVGYVPTVEHITAARALRMVGKRLGLDASEYEDAARVATRYQGVSLRELAEENRTIGVLYRQSEAFREVVSHAASIEGLPFGFARTKRTLVVSPHPLRDFLGYTVSPDTGEHFVQSTRDSFPTGAVSRIDVSTLHALAVVGAGEAVWEAGTAGFDLIEADDLDGVHLLEGAPRRLARAFGIQSFNDLVCFLALLRARDSTMSLGDRVVAFRGDAPPLPAATVVGDVLAPTNGWLLFKDQVRDVIARLTGLGPEDASRFVHRFGDRSPGGLAALRREFLSLTVEQSVSFEDASAWFGRLVRQAPQVIDRQRVIAESLITARCLTMKSARPLEFIARVLDHTADEDRRERYRETLEREGRWLAPDVRRSGRGFRVEGKRVRAPLWAIPGVSRDAADRILRFRGSAGVVESFAAFANAARENGVGDPAIEALLRAGAIPQAAGAPESERAPARRVERTPEPAQLAMPLGFEPASAGDDRPPGKDGNSRRGFRVLSNLLEFYPHPSASPVELAGRIRNLHEFRSRAGQTIGWFELYDATASVRVLAPWERLAPTEPLREGSRVVVRGRVRVREGRKVCDALEIVVTTEEGKDHANDSSDRAAKADS